MSAAGNGCQSGCPEALAAAVEVKALQYDAAAGKLAARLYRASSQPADSAILFFHAGGFVAGSLEQADFFARALAVACRMPVLSASYRLAGGEAGCAPFPAAVEDAYAALCWAVKHGKKLGEPKQWLVCGLEAGGNLAAVTAMVARDRGKPALAAQLLLMPMLDPGLNSASMRAMCDKPQAAGVADGCARAYREYLPRACDRAHPYASPLQSSRLKGLPPALLLSAEDDPLRDEALAYADKLAANGIAVRHARLQSVALADGAARGQCARQGAALQWITEFLQEQGLYPAA